MEGKRFEYAASLERDGCLLAAGGSPLRPGEAWTPEHLVLAGVMACTLKSLRYFAAGAAVSATAEASGVVARREEDGLYGLVELEVSFEVELEPAPAPGELPGLLARAERGCFVGNSLRAKPRYVWKVNGEPVEAAS